MQVWLRGWSRVEIESFRNGLEASGVGSHVGDIRLWYLGFRVLDLGLKI